MEITFDQLPKAVLELQQTVNTIHRLLLEKSIEPTSEPDRWFDLIELINYLPDKPAKATVYGWVHSGLIPCNKGAKKLRFLKSEIDNWLKQGRRKTLAEIKAEAEAYKRKGSNR